MKRLIVFLLTALTVAAFMGLTVSAGNEMLVEIPYAKTRPVLDGVVTSGEYPGDAIVMDDRTAEAWVGEMTRETSTAWNFAWDESGLYVCATVMDDTPVYRDENTHWVGADCVEIGLNPGLALDQPDDKGVFFSMGATADGKVVVYRHNYDEKIVSSEVRGCAVGHTEGSSSYTIEVCIPWSLIFIEADCTKTDTHLDATRLVAEECLIMDMVPAAIDAVDDSTISTAYKFSGTDFVTGKYISAFLTGTTTAETAETAETVGSTPADTTPVTRPEAETTLDLIIVPATTSEETVPGEPDSESDTVVSEPVASDASQGCAGFAEGAMSVSLLCLGCLCLAARKKRKTN